MLGHTKLSTTDLYTDVDEEMLEEDMAGIEEKMAIRKAFHSPNELVNKS